MTGSQLANGRTATCYEKAGKVVFVKLEIDYLFADCKPFVWLKFVEIHHSITFGDVSTDAALRVLRKAADSWASGGLGALSSDAVIAVLFRIYLTEWPEYGGVRGETRDLKAWLGIVSSAREEITTLRPSAYPEVILAALTVIEAEVSFAISHWTLGDPESPPTAHVLNTVEHILFAHRFTRRPGSSGMPTSFLDNE